MGSLRQRSVCGRVRELPFDLGKVIFPVKDNSTAAFVCWEDDNVGIGSEGVESRVQ